MEFKSSVEIGPDGAKLKNFIISSSGTIQRPATTFNGFAVSYYEECDDEGNRYLRPCLSVMFLDRNLEMKLIQAARKLIPHLPIIPIIETIPDQEEMKDG